jgi:hypothetical protein
VSNENDRDDAHAAGEPCTDSKLLALHTSTLCLARALALSGVLDRKLFALELAHGRGWLAQFDQCGHNVQAFDELAKMLREV